MPRSDWTDERVALLKKLWTDGFSASQCAARIGNGVTRNAVIGKATRLKLPNHNHVVFAKGGPRKAVLAPVRMWHPKIARTEPPKDPTPIPAPAADDVARVQFDQLEPHHCRFIPGEPKDGFCGLPKAPGLSYCPSHAARCHTTPTPRNYTEESRARRDVGARKGLITSGAMQPLKARLHPVDTRDLETIA